MKNVWEQDDVKKKREGDGPSPATGGEAFMVWLGAVVGTAVVTMIVMNFVAPFVGFYSNLGLQVIVACVVSVPAPWVFAQMLPVRTPIWTFIASPIAVFFVYAMVLPRIASWVLQ